MTTNAPIITPITYARNKTIITPPYRIPHYRGSIFYILYSKPLFPLFPLFSIV